MFLYAYYYQLSHKWSGVGLTVVLSRELAGKFTDFLKTENINFDIEKYRKIASVFVHIENLKKPYICDVLSEFVINSHIKRYVNSYINTEFYFFEKNEREKVTKDVLSRINKCEISQKIESFFDEKDQIILDGFFKFRMKDYTSYVDALIYDATEKMTAEKELNEFIKLLKYFVSIGDSVCDRVHVLQQNDEYILLDDNGKSPVDELLVMYEFSDMEHLPEDDLLNNLVSIAPRNIVIHNAECLKNDENLSVIYKVFEKTIEFCDGKCKFCREIYDIEKPRNV